MVFIAENGSLVMRRGHEVSSDCLARKDALALVRTLRAAADEGVDGGVVVCGMHSARLQVVDDLTKVIDDDVLKIAVYDFDSAEHSTLPHLSAFADSHKVTVSGEHWLDVNAKTSNKGHAITALQTAFGITPAQTMVFGDFLNDLEMMDTADYAFAMHNAHPVLQERAKFVAPSNNENGVVRTIASILNIPLG